MRLAVEPLEETVDHVDGLVQLTVGRVQLDAHPLQVHVDGGHVALKRFVFLIPKIKGVHGNLRTDEK